MADSCSLIMSCFNPRNIYAYFFSANVLFSLRFLIYQCSDKALLSNTELEMLDSAQAGWVSECKETSSKYCLMLTLLWNDVFFPGCLIFQGHGGAITCIAVCLTS